MALPWFRLYSEFATDPVVQSLSFDDQRHFIIALCLKCSGLLDKAFDTTEARTLVLKRALGLDNIALADANDRLVSAGLVNQEWQPANWEKRQFSSDHDAAERKRRQRLRYSSQRSHNEVTTNGSDSHAPDTDTDTDTDKPKRARKRVLVVPKVTEQPPEGLDLTAWGRWFAYRNSTTHKILPASIGAAMRKLASFGSAQAEVVENSIANSYQGLFAPKTSGPKSKARLEQLYPGHEF